MIGALGDVTFEVSISKVFTFDNLSFSHSAKYAEHAIHNRKNILEFTGLNASSASLTIKLEAQLGITPEYELDRLHEMLETHQAIPFILDGKIQGWSRWVIESLEESHKIIDNTGALISAEVNIKLKEYLRDIE